MSDSLENTPDPIDPAGATDQAAARNPRLYQALAWVGIVAGVLFTVAVIFFSGFFLGRASDGHGWHRGYQGGQMRPDGQMGGGCPMMQMQPGGMQPGGMQPGGMGPGGMKGPASSPMMPTPPTAGQR